MRIMSNAETNITGFTIYGACMNGIYRDVDFGGEPEYENVKSELKWLVKLLEDDKRLAFLKDECHMIIDFTTTPITIQVHKSFQSYTKSIITPASPYLVIKKEKKKLIYTFHDTRKIFPFNHRERAIKRFNTKNKGLTYGEIYARNEYNDLNSILNQLAEMLTRRRKEREEKEKIKVDHFEYISDERIRSYKDIECWRTYVEYENVMNRVLLDIYNYIKNNYCLPMRESFIVPLKNPTVFLQKGCDDVITIRGKEEKYRNDYSINIVLNKNYIHVNFYHNNSSLIPSMQCENLLIIPVSKFTNYKYLFDEMEKMKSIFILPVDKKVEVKSLIYFNKKGNCAIFDKDTEICKDMADTIMKQYTDILGSIKTVCEDNKDILDVLEEPIVCIDEREHTIEIRTERRYRMPGVTEYITIEYHRNTIKSEYIKKVKFKITDRKPIPDLIIKPKKACDVYLGETIEKSIDKSKEALKSMYKEKLKWKRKGLKTSVNSLTVREEKTCGIIKEKSYTANEVLKDEDINFYFNNLKYIFEPLLKEPIDINQVDYILGNTNISLVKNINGEYKITITQEITDCIIGSVHYSIEIVKRGDFLRYYYVRTDLVYFTTEKEELFNLHLNGRDREYPSAITIWNNLDLTLQGLLGYFTRKEYKVNNEIYIKCVEYIDENDVHHTFEDEDWKENKSYKFIKEKLLSVLDSLRDIEIKNEYIKKLLENALIEVRDNYRKNFLIRPFKKEEGDEEEYWIMVKIENEGVSFKYSIFNTSDYNIERECHLYYSPIEKGNEYIYYLIPDLIKVFENIRYNERITIKNIYNKLDSQNKKVSVNNRLSSYIARLVNEIIYINNEPFVDPGEYDVAVSTTFGNTYLYIRKSDDLNYKYDIMISEKYIELFGNSRSTITENEEGIQGEYYRKIKRICDSIIEEIDKYSYIEVDEETEELEEITEENGMKVIITEDDIKKAIERANDYTNDYKGDFSLDKLEQKEINGKYQIILYYSKGE